MVFIICTIIAGIGSEFIQHAISPFRTFDSGDIIANVSGSTLAMLSSIIYRRLYTKHKYRKGEQVGLNLEDEMHFQHL